MTQAGYLGIDLGTQGLSVIYTDADLNVLHCAEGHYDMVSGLAEGCYEQRPSDWEAALVAAMKELHAIAAKAGRSLNVAAIGISGQMHGEVQIIDAEGNARDTRLWCDARNDAESEELTQRFRVKMPKRMTAVRWLYSLRQRPELGETTPRLTTPGGWLALRLTGEHVLGIGDASGMFPIDQATLSYDTQLLREFDEIAQGISPRVGTLAERLPAPRRAGEEGGRLTAHGASLLGLPEGTPVAPAEGDQPAAMAGSLIGRAGWVSMSFGTSVCANSVGDRTFDGVSSAIDHFCAADGKPINMVWLRNGTTFMNSIVQMVGSVATDSDFAAVIPLLLQAPHDCGGLLALPFMDDEPGVGVLRGGTGTLIGLNASNATPGNAARAALMATIFNLRIGSDQLRAQGFPLEKIVLSGGLTKSPGLGQLVADCFGASVVILASGAEGSAWGAALTAKYRAERLGGASEQWDEFLEQHASPPAHEFTPCQNAGRAMEGMLTRYKKLLELQEPLQRAVQDGA